ncbi:phosphatidylinositol 3-kinase regulatory subunit gamma [Aplysia californica]|uniref:Phosphatidylinositol 3-kinase regulatory subunit gamma n=1 Tax=Aplysia californica TaxID=6500 RepID=A0ABM0ZWC5_APLCA|nr:phosphatidylinositol 3-kinase regulatory subunit gamma [Aplysia californica]
MSSSDKNADYLAQRVERLGIPRIPERRSSLQTNRDGKSTSAGSVRTGNQFREPPPIPTAHRPSTGLDVYVGEDCQDLQEETESTDSIYYNCSATTALGQGSAPNYQLPDELQESSPGSPVSGSRDSARKTNFVTNGRSKSVQIGRSGRGGSQGIPSEILKSLRRAGSVGELPDDGIPVNPPPQHGSSGSTQYFGNSQNRPPSWFWGTLTRVEADEKLNGLPDGTFLVRNSTTPGDYTLTVKQDGQNRCLKIYQRDGLFGFKLTDLKFGSLNGLIDHHTKHTLAEFNRRLTTHLLYPIRRIETTTVNLYEALFILANRGRQLFKARQEYTRLMEQQLSINNALQLAMMKQKALETARDMYEPALGSDSGMSDYEDMIPLTVEQQKMLEKSRSLSMQRHMKLSERVKHAHEEMEHKEEELYMIILAINEHATILGDQEEDCERIKEQLLDCGAKPEFVECLLDNRYLEHTWDPALWLVKCSRQEAEAKLRDEDVGTFIIRPRGEPQKPYALSVVCSKEEGTQEVNHCFIFHPKGEGFGFRVDGAVFETIEELVARHAYTNLKVYFSHMDTQLVRPVFAARSRTVTQSSVEGAEDNM